MKKNTKKILFALLIFFLLIILAFFLVSIFNNWQEGKKEIKVDFKSFLKAYEVKNIPGQSTSFTEIFSGDGWKDKERSSIYQDFTTRIISFPPKYNFREAAGRLTSKKNYREFENTFCPEKASKCLSLVGDKAYFAKQNGERLKPIFLPFKVSAVGKTNSFWILLSSEEKDGKFSTTIYRFDGVRVKKLAGPDFFLSDSVGEFILGGSDSDFLAGFYGKESRVLRFLKKDKNYYDAWDVSFWFNTKLAKDLKDVIFLKTKAGYVFYSKTKPLFILVNSSFPIDFTKTLGLEKSQKVKIESLEDEKYFYITADLGDGKEKFFLFENLGFDKTKPFGFYSKTLAPLFSEKKEIISAAILEYLGEEIGGKFKFYFSTDFGKEWTETKTGELKSFKSGSDLMWCVDFVPDLNNYLSPFIYQLQLSFSTK